MVNILLMLPLCDFLYGTNIVLVIVVTSLIIFLNISTLFNLK